MSAQIQGSNRRRGATVRRDTPAIPPAAVNDALAAELEALFRRTTKGIKPGLERIAALLERLGHPERAYAVIHVAGTNGKGSVCAMMESILRAAGLRTGLYTSPHLVRFHERIRVNGEPVGDEALARVLHDVRAQAEALEAQAPAAQGATFFEIATAMAFEQFRRDGVQVAVVETGMGGRWDATNVVRPVVAVLTPIGLDHAEYLGSTLTAIAGEKCGIIKAGRPVVSGVEDPEAAAVVQAAAEAARAPLIPARGQVSVRRGAQDLDGQRVQVETADGLRVTATLALLGAHQLGNTAMAVAAVEAFAGALGVELPPAAYRKGLETVRWPARLQVLEREPPMVLDGAHNPHGARALAAALGELRGRRPVALVCGLLADKDAAGVLQALAPVAARAWMVPLHHAGGRAPAELAALARTAGLQATDAATLAAALDEARAWAAAQGGMVCIAGSLYLAGEVLALRGGGPPPHAGR